MIKVSFSCDFCNKNGAIWISDLNFGPHSQILLVLTPAEDHLRPTEGGLADLWSSQILLILTPTEWKVFKVYLLIVFEMLSEKGRLQNFARQGTCFMPCLQFVLLHNCPRIRRVRPHARGHPIFRGLAHCSQIFRHLIMNVKYGSLEV